MARGTELVIRISGDSKKFRKELDKVRKEARKTSESLTKAFGPKANKNVANLASSVVKLSAAEKKAAKAAEKAAIAAKKAAEERERRTERRIRNIKRVAAALAVLAVAGITASIIEFAKFEQGLAGVSKTTNIVGKELEDLGDEISSLSIKLGTSTGELFELAKSAGQLGITGSKNILKFTEVMAGLAKTTNIVGEEGAIALARLIKVTDENIDNVDRLASVIVGLGNTTAALENEILFTAQQIAGAGKVFGITATQALGLGAAFAELAIPPELARGTVLRAFGKIQEAISEAGADMEKLILITGLTGEELEKTFAEDSVKVFGLFLKGVAKLPKSQLIPFLEDFNLAGLRLEATLPKLALGSDLVADKLKAGAKLFDENTAATKELGIQTDTTAFRYKELRAELALTRKQIGESFNPATEASIKLLKQLAPQISEVLVPSLVTFADKLSDLIDKTIEFKKEIGFVLEILGKIASVSFDLVIAPFAKLTQNISSAIKGVGRLSDVLDKLPKQGNIFRQGFETEEEETATGFGGLDETSEAEKIIEENIEIAAIRAAAREEEKEAREAAIQEQLDRDAELLAEKIELEGKELARKLQEIEDQKERDKQAAKDKVKADKKAVAVELALAKKAAAELIKLKETRVTEEKKLDVAISDSAFDTLSLIVGDNKAAQLALLLAQKAVAVSRIIINTEEAALLAFSSQLIPGNPASLATAAAAAIAVKAAGAAQVGIVLATAIPEIAGTFLRAQEGGIVPGGFGGGDRVPMLLEPGELIVPQNLNPLSPNFDETFAGAGGDQTVIVEIELTEDASQLITVNQREDSTLGVQT